MEGIENLAKLFEEKFGTAPSEIIKLPGAGSGRVYYRLRAQTPDQGTDLTCIGVDGADREENRCFIRLAQRFLKEGIRVPEIYGYEEEFRYYIQEDLGDVSLFSLLPKDGSAPEGSVRALMEASLRQLVRLQKISAAEWEGAIINRSFSARQVMWDLNYFKYEFLRPLDIPFNEERLENDFERLCGRIMHIAEAISGFMYRDFQSRNIMIKDSEPYFIDFQGGRKGPGLYDVVSLLWQAKARLPEAYRSEMLELYCREYTASAAERAKLHEGYRLFALLRTLQVLGAYGLRGLIEKKAHFLESIPAGIANLISLGQAGVLEEYPELKMLAQRLAEDPRFRQDNKKNTEGKLKIKVFSFSYKKGYPADYSGTGGGFMFDCRGMHNPGRYAEYRHLTGLDAPVIEFLEERGEVQEYTRNVITLVSPTVARYISRGFTSLQIGFGCTGGQHRSVYCAERVARELHRLFPEADVEVCHREQSKTPSHKFLGASGSHP